MNQTSCHKRISEDNPWICTRTEGHEGECRNPNAPAVDKEQEAAVNDAIILLKSIATNLIDHHALLSAQSILACAQDLQEINTAAKFGESPNLIPTRPRRVRL